MQKHKVMHGVLFEMFRTVSTSPLELHSGKVRRVMDYYDRVAREHGIPEAA